MRRVIGLYLISIANRILLLLARAPASSRLSAINLAHHLYGIADERRTHKMDFMSQLRDSQEKAELAVARGENMTMKILDLQKSLMCAEREETRLKKQLEETRAERDAAREDAQEKTATIAERDERIASLEHCIANIEFHCDATHGA